MIGLVVGKFAPLHKGHRFLLKSAQYLCDELVVMSYCSPNFGYSAESRAESIRRVVPDATILVTDQGIPHNNDPEYNHRIFCARWLESQNIEPDIVVSSETYGEPFSAFLSGFFNKQVSHYMVDLHRTVFPISATMIRGGGYDDWIV